MTKLTDADRAEINRLCEMMRKPSVGKIANRIGRSRGSIAWYMITRGLIERPVTLRASGGYMPEHDARIIALRARGLIPREISAVISAEFGIPRSSSSVKSRLARLAIVPDAVDLAEA